MPFSNGKIILIVVIGIAVVMAGCGGREVREDISPVDSVEAQEAVAATVEPTPTLLKELVEPVSPISPLSPLRKTAMVELIKGSESALAAAKADLAEQTGVPVDKIKLVSMEAVDWNDTSLGCPQEGFMYAQVITLGYLIVLEADGQQYEYHTDQTTNVVLCEQ